MNGLSNNESNAQIFQLSDEVEEFLSEKVNEKLHFTIHEAVSREEDRRYKQIKWFIAFIGVVGLGTFGTMANYLIEKAVDSRMEEKTGSLTESINFMRFYTLTLKLDLGTSYSNEDKEAIISYLRSAAKIDQIRYSKEFKAGLIQVAETFASSGQSAELDEIFSLYEKELLTTPTLVESFLHHYGQDIVGRSVIPTNDSSLATFEKLERAAANNSGELALYYRILFTYKSSQGKKSVTIEDLIRRIPHFNKQDFSRFMRELFRKSRATNWQRHSTPAGVEFETLTRKFLAEYAEVLGNKLHVPKELFLDASKKGVSDEDAAKLADSIAAQG